MSDDVNLESMANALKQGIDNNAQDSPRLSIDPDSQKMSVVGDPNNIKLTPKTYNLVFVYSADEVSEEDKVKMKYLEETNEYLAVVSYPGVRVKPLYRTKVMMMLDNILADLGVMTKDGYSSDMVNTYAAKLLTNHITEIAELTNLVLGVPEEQVSHLNAGCLYEFFNTLIDNEKNILAEGSNFLSSSQVQEMTPNRNK